MQAALVSLKASKPWVAYFSQGVQQAMYTIFILHMRSVGIIAVSARASTFGKFSNFDNDYSVRNIQNPQNGLLVGD